MRTFINKLLKTLNAKWIMKHLHFMQRVYFFIGHLLLRCMAWVVQTDMNQYLFISYTGEKFNDTPKAIFEYLYQLDKEKKNSYVWAFSDVDAFETYPDVKKVKIFTLKFYYYTLSSRFIISNATFSRNMNFKGRKTIYYNSWHGSALKKIGKDRSTKSNNFCPYGKCIVDAMSIQSDYDREVFMSAFSIPKERLILTGLPRNDEILMNDEHNNKQLKLQLGIPADKKVILYAPTYRNYHQDRDSNYIENIELDFSKWQKSLGNQYVILFRSHYYIKDSSKDQLLNSFIIDVTRYPNINDLYKISDILLSDYSSVFFDFSITGKPMICFPYDLKRYSKEVGLYVDLKKEMLNGIVTSEDQLIHRLATLNYTEEMEFTNRFKEKYIKKSGDATRATVEYLLALDKGGK